MKVGDIVRVDPDFYESNVVKLEKIFADDVPLLATVERCDGRPFHYIAYDGQKTPCMKKNVCVWESGLELIEDRRF